MREDVELNGRVEDNGRNVTFNEGQENVPPHGVHQQIIV